MGLALCVSGWTILIDCGGSPLYKLARHGVALESVQAVVLTHCHADHLYGFPMLVQGLWLSNRSSTLPVYGPEEAVSTARASLAVFSLDDPVEGLDIDWHPIAMREGKRVLEIDDIRLSSTPVCHGKRETVAIRMDNLDTGRAIVYSSDTEPCQALVRLAACADILLHEATGNHPGHSTPAEAAEVAREAGVSQLVLTHYPVHNVDLAFWRQQALGFPAPVTLAQDGDVYAF